MSLNDRQALRQLLRTPRFWATVLGGGVELGLKFHMFPLSAGLAHDVVFTAVLVLMLAGVVAVGVWQAPREHWGHDQKLRESMRRILANQPPLDGYEYLLDAPPPWAKPAPLPPAKEETKP